MEVEEIKKIVQKRLLTVSEEYRDGKKLENQAQYSRFWEGRCVELKHEKAFLENLLDVIKESEADVGESDSET